MRLIKRAEHLGTRRCIASFVALPLHPDIPGRHNQAMSGWDEHYWAKVNECRQKAARPSSPIDKIAWLRMAEAWLALPRRRPRVGLKEQARHTVDQRIEIAL
jgi:hypothetical protein